MPLKDSVVLLTLIDILLFGHAFSMLQRLWDAREIEDQLEPPDPNTSQSRPQANEPTRSAWEALDSSLRESWRAIGVTVATISTLL